MRFCSQHQNRPHRRDQYPALRTCDKWAQSLLGRFEEVGAVLLEMNFLFPFGSSMLPIRKDLMN
jgi:hypothetical protein